MESNKKAIEMATFLNWHEGTLKSGKDKKTKRQ